MAHYRITVFLPCHSLDDFPTWLEEEEADELLAAWTSAWHPALIASYGCVPSWASVDAPPADPDAMLGIVPPRYDDRFAGWIGSLCTAGSRFVRHVADRDAIVAACGVAGPPCTMGLTADFHALGLAWLLGELLARRMRSATGLETNGFHESVVAAARAAVAGDDDVARSGLREAFGCLEASRSHYYPVDVWLVDLILLAESTLGRTLAEEMESPVPAALVATGDVIESLARRNPELLDLVRRRCAERMLAPAGGRLDSRPIDQCVPESILESFTAGRRAWREHLGVAPATYAQCAGGASAILPQVLRQFGYAGAIWNLFDGTPLPDPGGGRIRWEGSGGACIDAIARPPLDARSARTVLSLAQTIGDAMDHDHTVVVPFAHHPGTASRWYLDLRRIGSWTSALGTFVTPDDLFARTSGAGSVVAFEPDTFPVTPPADSRPAADGEPVGDAIGDRVATARDEARRLSEARRTLTDVLPDGARRPGSEAVAPGGGSPSRPAGLWRAIAGGFFVAGAAADEHLVLQNDAIRVQVQRATGGILSVRRPGGRNLLSQRLSLRSTRPAPETGGAWESVEERAEHSRMVADGIEKDSQAGGLVSHGRLIDAGDRALGSFTQRMTLVGRMPLVMLDIDVRLDHVVKGPLFEEHAACRFAWSENSDIVLRRSLHTQSIETERSRIPATHFIELCVGGRTAGSADPDRMAILTAGLPWHVRSGPHMLDSILLGAGGRAASRRLALGVGIERPWDVAIAILNGEASDVAGWTLPANVRITAAPVVREGGRVVAARVGLLECAGRSGPVSIEWAADIELARACDAAGTPLDDAVVDYQGRTTTVHLHRHQWLHLDIRFRHGPPVMAS